MPEGSCDLREISELAWPQMNNMGLERLIRLVPGKKYHVQIIVDDTIATLYVDGVALNTRMYTNTGGRNLPGSYRWKCGI